MDTTHGVSFWDETAEIQKPHRGFYINLLFQFCYIFSFTQNWFLLFSLPVILNFLVKVNLFEREFLVEEEDCKDETSDIHVDVLFPCQRGSMHMVVVFWWHKRRDRWCCQGNTNNWNCTGVCTFWNVYWRREVFERCQELSAESSNAWPMQHAGKKEFVFLCVIVTFQTFS